jgi:SNF2 family DNA or RNA helicase
MLLFMPSVPSVPRRQKYSKKCKFLFTRSKVKFIRIDGATAPEKRQGLVRMFQENASCRAAVLSITSAGVGLTLTVR